MRIGKASYSPLWALAFPLALLALALPLLVPPGYMVGGHGGEPARIVICTGHGPINAAIDLGQPAPVRGRQSHAPCVFASLAAPSHRALAGPLIAAAWRGSPAPVDLPRNQVFVGRGLAAPPPARAPPVSRV